ncbi:MAG: CHRD domain-containing protein [Candidatus Omnitrophota bacterium]
MSIRVVVLLSLSLCSLDSYARSYRVNLIPNGNANQCANCHVNPGGGGTRNAFGKAVEQLINQGAGDSFWGAALAIVDSDGDGATNGVELQDADGVWKPGNPAPGVLAKVTKPGDAQSFPAAEPTPTPTATPVPLSVPNAHAAYLSGGNVNPKVETTARGIAIFRVYETEKILDYYLDVFDLNNVTASHIHLGAAGENGAVAIPLTAPTQGKSSGRVTITDDNLANLKSGRFYVNVHTEQNPAGEIRGQIMDKPLQFMSALDGAQTTPPTTTGATGEARLTLSEGLIKLSYTVTVRNIENISASHIHIGGRGENGGVSIPIASGPFDTISGEADLSADQLDALLGERFYINVHTSQNPAGEIRGQIEFDAVEFGDGSTGVEDWMMWQ